MEVVPGQVVVDTGPFVVRHPGYTAVTAFIVGLVGVFAFWPPVVATVVVMGYFLRKRIAKDRSSGRPLVGEARVRPAGELGWSTPGSPDAGDHPPLHACHVLAIAGDPLGIDRLLLWRSPRIRNLADQRLWHLDDTALPALVEPLVANRITDPGVISTLPCGW